MESTNIPADVKEEGNKDEVSYQLDLISNEIIRADQFSLSFSFYARVITPRDLGLLVLLQHWI